MYSYSPTTDKQVFAWEQIQASVTNMAPADVKSSKSYGKYGASTQSHGVAGRRTVEH